MNNYLTTNYDLNSVDLVSVIDELPLWSAPFGLRLLEKINYRKNLVALDIGSGTGFPLLEVAMRLGNSCKVYGLDPWEAALERAKNKIKIYGIHNCELFCGVAEKIPLPDMSVDLIFSNNGLNNVNDIETVMMECKRICRPGAQLVFSYNTDKTMFEFYSVLEEVLLKKNMQAELDMMKKHIYQKRKPVDEYVCLLKKYGYGVDDTSEHKFDYRFVDGTTMLNHFLIKLAFIESWKNIIPESLRVEIFSEIEKRHNEHSNNARFLTLTIPFVIINATKN
ncbi:MAG: class I SAM-dependent methyltransferase [bacterium]|nr:class I SAM-dependent methyltransferase [bacterium]